MQLKVFNNQLKNVEYVILPIVEMETANPTSRGKMFILEQNPKD